MPKIKITAEQVQAWLGSDSTLDEAISIITDVANGEYKPAVLRGDILDYDCN